MMITMLGLAGVLATVALEWMVNASAMSRNWVHLIGNLIPRGAAAWLRGWGVFYWDPWQFRRCHQSPERNNILHHFYAALLLSRSRA